MQISHPLQNYNKNSLIKVSYKDAGWALGEPDPLRRTPQVSSSQYGQTDTRTDGHHQFIDRNYLKAIRPKMQLIIWKSTFLDFYYFFFKLVSEVTVIVISVIYE